MTTKTSYQTGADMVLVL